ncbi:hypothetical protein [Haloterrigena salifodinae]|uniref:Uncharacterized protein n=1 Tax=Haloterrigena salifodinae TaxID=2675099 RepID=A0A8T8E3F1_9EURY|nr:hypothetical protein [Haloterrigena salifodinae]QRV16117.1 hypothetical protein JMJ58_04260 [Haloterrigena salifodinae]
MGLERFVRLNLILLPVLVTSGYLLRDSIPLILYIPVAGYCIFAGIICFTWLLSQLEMFGQNS